jgi:hypothetical protein
LAVHADRQALTGALGHLSIFPRQLLLQSLVRQIEARSLPIFPLDDYALAEAVRNRVATPLPQNVQALLDIRINQAGYYASQRAGGFTPHFEISALLWDTVNPGVRIDAFDYAGDFRDARGDRRFFTTPKDLSSTDERMFRTDPEKFRPGLIRLFDDVASMLLDDMHRLLNKQPRLN